MSVKVIAATLLVLMVGGAACADPPPPAAPDPISIDRWSPSVTGGWNFPADIYGEVWGAGAGGWDVGGPGPVLHIPFFNYSLGNADNNDAHSLGNNDPNRLPIVYFSADRWSLGLWATQYRHQAVRNQAAGDRFVTNGWMDRSPANSYATGIPANLVPWIAGAGRNLLSANQTRYNEIPTMGWWVVNPTMDPMQIDDMDALELHAMDVDGDRKHDQHLFFSLDWTSPRMPPGASAADIFVSFAPGPAFWVWATAASMGLIATMDDIDALVVFHRSTGDTAVPGTDYALFSLEPGNSLNADPSDVFVTSFQGFSRLYFTGPTVGLRKPDILDGLDIEPYIEGQTLPQVFDEIEEDPPPPLVSISQARANPDGMLVNTSGIVTLIGSTFLYIESPDRSSGIRVQGPPPWYVALGDDLQVIGILGMFDGERVINPTVPVSPISSGNPLPGALDMRSRAVGGAALDALNPSVTNGRGAFNVGLRIRYMGMITAVDAAMQWFYVWDGANHIYGGASMPVNDGSGNLGVRIERGPTVSMVPWQTWVEITGVVSTDAAAVPGNVIPTIIPSAIIETAAFDTINMCSLEANWNLIGLPAGPAGISDGVEHSAKPWDPPVVFTGGDPFALDARMYRWESCNQSLYTWDMWSDDHTMGWFWGPFGGVLLGDGYWLNMPAAQPINYTGKLSDLDQWISICQAGWILIGHPKPHDIALEDVTVHDGGQVVTLLQASQWGWLWLNSVGYWWDATTQSLVDIGLYEWDWPTTNELQPCHGYWFEIYQDDKAFIIPEVTTYVPPW